MELGFIQSRVRMGDVCPVSDSTTMRRQDEDIGSLLGLVVRPVSVVGLISCIIDMRVLLCTE